MQYIWSLGHCHILPIHSYADPQRLETRDHLTDFLLKPIDGDSQEHHLGEMGVEGSIWIPKYCEMKIVGTTVLATTL